MKVAGSLAAVALATFAVVAVATRAGTGVSTDSVAYLAEARSLRAGHGFALPAGVLELYDEVGFGRDALPSTHFPPLYPAVLAATGLAGDGSAVRWLNAVLLGLTAAMVATMVRRYTRSALVAAGAVVLIVFAPAVLRVHAMAWSEPLFVTLGLAGLLALAAFVARPRPATLLFGALGTGGAWLTRHIGVAFVVAGLVVLWRFRHRRGAVAYLAVAVLPMAAFLAVTARAGGGDGYTLALAPPAAIALLGAGGLVLWWVARLPAPAGTAAHDLTALPLLLGVTLAGYVAIAVASQVVFVEDVRVDERLVVPAYGLAVPLVACVLSRHRTAAPSPLVAALAVLAVVAGAGLVPAGATSYPGFAAPEWRRSEAMAVLDELPATTRIYSNFPEAIYLRTGRPARLVPPPGPGPGLARLVADVRSGDGVVVLFTSASRPDVAGAEALNTALGLPPPVHVGDALIYRVGVELIHRS